MYFCKITKIKMRLHQNTGCNLVRMRSIPRFVAQEFLKDKNV